ncbi:MAG TPA: hypothetical protein VNJ46_06595 [Gaiellaceae bacterium]|nr:hypothetical protein [Gaiellaceae bacterium]
MARFLGFDDRVWEEMQRTVEKGERYAIVAEGERKDHVVTYATYRLLPGIRVLDPVEAEVVFYYHVDDAPEPCTALGERVCALERTVEE